MKHKKLIEDIKTYSQYFLDIIDTVERKGQYKLRKHIKLSDKELKEMIEEATQSFLVIIRNVLCYEDFLTKKKLKDKSIEYIQEVIDEYGEMIKKA